VIGVTAKIELQGRKLLRIEKSQRVTGDALRSSVRWAEE
jgi:hypothetical protein